MAPTKWLTWISFYLSLLLVIGATVSIMDSKVIFRRDIEFYMEVP